MSEFILLEEDSVHDAAAFWQLFENYIIEEIHSDNMDDHLLMWYFSDDYRSDLIRRLKDDSHPLSLLMVYEPFQNSRMKLGSHSRKHSFIDRLFRSADSSKPQPNEKGAYVGFCLYEWSGASSESCRIICYCILNPMKEKGYQQPAWEEIEDYLFHRGVDHMFLDRKILVPFWKVNNFVYDENGYWSKKL